MMHPGEIEGQRTVEVGGVRYFSAGDVAKAVGVSRQTLWRWRQEGKIPAGHRYRDRQVLFTAEELEAIKEYAHRIEPIAPTEVNQLKLFNGSKGGRT